MNVHTHNHERAYTQNRTHTYTCTRAYYAHAQKNKYMASPPLCSERNGMATPHIAQDTYDIHGDATWLEGSIFGDADAVL